MGERQAFFEKVNDASISIFHVEVLSDWALMGPFTQRREGEMALSAFFKILYKDQVEL